MADETVLGDVGGHQLHEVERGQRLEGEARHMLDRLLKHLVGEAQGQELHEIERELFAQLMDLGATLLKRFLAAKGTGHVGPTATRADGASLPYHSMKTRAYFSVFDKFEIERAYYWESGSAGVCPLDGQLNLPEGCYSYLLREWAELLGVEHAYEKATATLEAILRVRLPKRSVGLIARSAAPDVQSFYEAGGAPSADSEGELLVAAIDGKGVPMRRAEPRPKKLRLGSGEKPNRKKEATVTAVCTIDRHERDAEDIVREIRDDATTAPPSGELPPRPKPRNKRVRATLAGKDAAFAEVRRQLDERDPAGIKERVILTDGDEALQDRALALGSPNNRTIVLDIMHVLTYLWSAAYAFHREGSAEAARWVMAKLRLLLVGKVGYVIGGLRQSLAKHHFRGSKRKALEAAIRYMARNRDFMQYDVFLANGYPIGTGIAEGACRNLVRDRMELVGMHWTEPGAQAILELRAVKLNHDWEAFWKHRARRERIRLYGAPGAPPVQPT
jgi:hypothetical protein